jgi:hypothetical protein
MQCNHFYKPELQRNCTRLPAELGLVYTVGSAGATLGWADQNHAILTPEFTPPLFMLPPLPHITRIALAALLCPAGFASQPTPFQDSPIAAPPLHDAQGFWARSELQAQVWNPSTVSFKVTISPDSSPAWAVGSGRETGSPPFQSRSEVGRLVLDGVSRIIERETLYPDGARGWAQTTTRLGVSSSLVARLVDSSTGEVEAARTTERSSYSAAAGPDLATPIDFGLGRFHVPWIDHRSRLQYTLDSQAVEHLGRPCVRYTLDWDGQPGESLEVRRPVSLTVDVASGLALAVEEYSRLGDSFAVKTLADGLGVTVEEVRKVAVDFGGNSFVKFREMQVTAIDDDTLPVPTVVTASRWLLAGFREDYELVIGESSLGVVDAEPRPPEWAAAAIEALQPAATPKGSEAP